MRANEYTGQNLLNCDVVSLEVNRETWQGGKGRVWLFIMVQLKSLEHRVTRLQRIPSGICLMI